LYLFHRDKWFREFYKLPELVHADGMGIVLLSALGKEQLKAEHRTTYIDWMPDLVAMAAQQGWRLFYVGSRPGIADRGVAMLRQAWPQLQIETAHGYFDATRDSVENQNLIRRIQECEPHILLVGMGMPRQERWIAQNFAELPCNVILPSGAAIDYIAGALSTPPRWMGRLGLEWLFRLVTEPKRLAFRYLIEPWYIARLVALHILSGSWIFRFVRNTSTNGD
jgi:N-acetylglucosaminyldiphosphoundecaprenol N-acetyl-beta-D-mannosaminyltransferase